ncbi:MAG: dephospho-CoA kinase [Flavobacteriaceae bacterium]|nr:dephospho-CoA kinase [Flavobacteriaceae bacterium]
MIVVGLTGGIGSGKTTVANLFFSLGVPVYFADQHAKRLMETSKAVKKKLIHEFGKKAYHNGKLNRAYLAEVVFNDTSKLAAINSIVHPSVANSFKRWIGKQNSAYVIQENAILFETNSNRKFDYTILVTAPLEERIRRVMQRDEVTKQQVLARIDNQLPDDEKIDKADFVITNTDLKKTKAEVLKIHKKIMDVL